MVAVVAGIGSQWGPGAWYPRLEKPSWTPPNWVFGPVWTTLYILMAVAAWRVWRPDGFRAAPVALTLFVAQLMLNGAWSYLFFGRRDIGVALAEIVVLWVAILATLLAFWRRDRIAGGLLIPYLAWVTLATALNFEIWRMNA